MLSFFLKLFRKARKVAVPVMTQPPQKQEPPISDTKKTTRRQINKEGLDLIKHFESLELSAYPDPVSPLARACLKAGFPLREYTRVKNWKTLDGSPWTKGYGHTKTAKPGDILTEAEADRLLSEDLREYEEGVESLVKADISDNKFAALVSFAFNVGLDIDEDTKVEGLGDSTLLKKVNNGDFAGAAQEFVKWSKARNRETGQLEVISGLLRRREAERNLFLKE